MLGAGYVGLVSAACFAEFGWHVACVDSDHDKVDQLNRGNLPIYEPGLDSLLERNTVAGRIKFFAGPEAVADADVVFLAVGTHATWGWVC